MTEGVNSPLSKISYRCAVNQFLDWIEMMGNPPFIKATLDAYKAFMLEDLEYAPSTVNQKLSAIRSFTKNLIANNHNEAQNKLISGLLAVDNVKSQGIRQGNWLNREQAQQLLNTPDPTTTTGKRDRAILSVLLGAGLRRAEVAGLTVKDIQLIEARWAIVDLMGKGRRVRTIPIPSWAKQAIDLWLESVEITSGSLFVPLSRGGNLIADASSLSPHAIGMVVKKYGEICKTEISAHDLRRTFAKLARKGGSDLAQIQLSLGHASVTTTQRYVNEDQDFTTAPCDLLGIKIN